ncbi:MAG: hypothetical protein NUK65_01830 [Firmicutes bacterium]|nr:hypothetical protein [Bacillota bacterium]
MQLNSRELVQYVLQNGVVDQIPKGELCINDAVLHKTMNVTQAGFEEKVAFVQTMGLDIFSLSPLCPEGMKSLPDKNEYHYQDVKKWALDTPYFTFAVLDGAFEWGMRLLGTLEFCSNLRSKLVMDELIAQVEKLNMYMIDKLAAEGINGFILADDIAFQQGLFANPIVLRDLFIPSLARQAERILIQDLPVFFHSDGNYTAVIDDIVKIGVSGLQCLEKTAGMHIKQLQERVGPQVCLWGHLDTDDLERAVTDPSTREDLANTARKLARGNKFMLGTTSGLYEAMDMDTLRTLYAGV